jgi:hypothetical protein
LGSLWETNITRGAPEFNRSAMSWPQWCFHAGFNHYGFGRMRLAAGRLLPLLVFV